MNQLLPIPLPKIGYMTTQHVVVIMEFLRESLRSINHVTDTKF